MTTLRFPASAPSVTPDLLAAIAAWDQAACSLAALALGGTPLDEAEASDLLRGAGLTSVRSSGPGNPTDAGYRQR